VPRSARNRAPIESGQTLAAPPWRELADLLAENHDWRRRTNFEVLGRPLSELVSDARSEVLRRSAAPVGPTGVDAVATGPDIRGDRPLIVTGHQPGLVHPGVWLKNFAAAELAAAHAGVGLHVVIDADVLRTPAILVPAGTAEAPRFEAVEFDRPTAPLPWEERRILDEDLWFSFPARVRDACSQIAPDRYLDEWWPFVINGSAATGLVGASFAQARHAAEVAWGIHNAELPQSQLCQTATFRWLACAVFADLPRFMNAYNAVLVEYRRQHGLRNHAHPVPNLALDGPWLEAPFWIWDASDSRRRALFVRRVAGGVVLSDRRKLERLLPLSSPPDAAAAVAALENWETSGVKIRSRALVTTMFTRLAVADLFIHGIGGAKYDEATDAICARFFGAAPPKFATVSGTLRLPIAHPQESVGESARLRCQLRDLRFHPERYLDFPSYSDVQRKAGEMLAAEKSRWVQTPKRPENAAERHLAIVAANNAMQSLVLAERVDLEERLASALNRSRANRVLDSREFAFCLFPRKMLVQFLLDFRREAL
jgi:hypothetical protein